MNRILTPEQIFNKVLSDLTNGFIPDFNTAILACITVMILFAGGMILLDFIDNSFKHRIAAHRQQMTFAQNVFDSKKAFNEAANYRALRDVAEEGSLDYDYYNSLYRSELSKSVKLSSDTGNSFSTSGGLSSAGGYDTGFDKLFADSSGGFDEDPGPSDDDCPYWA